jgi:hypothetical protein
MSPLPQVPILFHEDSSDLVLPASFPAVATRPDSGLPTPRSTVGLFEIDVLVIVPCPRASALQNSRMAVSIIFWILLQGGFYLAE